MMRRFLFLTLGLSACATPPAALDAPELPTEVFETDGGGSYPGDCAKAPYEKRLNLEKVPTIDQDGLSTCTYATMAADLGHRFGKPVSTLCLALSRPADYGDRINPRTSSYWFELAAGYCDAFDTVKRHGKFSFASDVAFENLTGLQGAKVVKLLLNYRDQIQGLPNEERMQMRERISRAMDDGDLACEVAVDAYVMRQLSAYYSSLNPIEKEMYRGEIQKLGIFVAPAMVQVGAGWASRIRHHPLRKGDPLESLSQTLSLPVSWAPRIKASRDYVPYAGCGAEPYGKAAREIVKDYFGSCSGLKTLESELSDQTTGSILMVLSRMDASFDSDREFLQEALGCNKNPQAIPEGMECDGLQKFTQHSNGIHRTWKPGKHVSEEENVSTVRAGWHTLAESGAPDLPGFGMGAKYIRESIEKNRLVSLAMCLDVLKKEGPIGKIVGEGPCGVMAVDEIGPMHRDFVSTHMMSVIGYRTTPKSGGGCKVDYLIRNSWGADCNMLSSRFKPHCDPKTGEFWMSQDILERISMELGTLTTPKDPKLVR